MQHQTVFDEKHFARVRHVFTELQHAEVLVVAHLHHVICVTHWRRLSHACGKKSFAQQWRHEVIASQKSTTFASYV